MDDFSSCYLLLLSLSRERGLGFVSSNERRREEEAKKRAAEHSIPKGLLHGNAAASGQGIELRTGEKGEGGGGGGKRERRVRCPLSAIGSTYLEWASDSPRFHTEKGGGGEWHGLGPTDGFAPNCSFFPFLAPLRLDASFGQRGKRSGGTTDCDCGSSGVTRSRDF